MLRRIRRIVCVHKIERLNRKHTRNNRYPEASEPSEILYLVRTQAKHVFACRENYIFESRGPIFLWLLEKSHNTQRKTKKNTIYYRKTGVCTRFSSFVPCRPKKNRVRADVPPSKRGLGYVSKCENKFVRDAISGCPDVYQLSVRTSKTHVFYSLLLHLWDPLPGGSGRNPLRREWPTVSSCENKRD